MPVILTFGTSGSVGAQTAVTGSTSSSSAGTTPLSVVQARNQTPIPKEPIRNPIFDGDGTDFGRQVVAALGNINRTWVYYWQRRPTGTGGGGGGAGGFQWRTLLLKDTTPGTNIADNQPVIGLPFGVNSTCQEVVRLLRKAITADLTVRLTIYNGGTAHLVGSFTIPKATPVHTSIRFSGSQIAYANFPDLAALVWDVVASDSSKDNNGIGSFTVVWQ